MKTIDKKHQQEKTITGKTYSKRRYDSGNASGNLRPADNEADDQDISPQNNGGSKSGGSQTGSRNKGTKK